MHLPLDLLLTEYPIPITKHHHLRLCSFAPSAGADEGKKCVQTTPRGQRFFLSLTIFPILTRPATVKRPRYWIPYCILFLLPPSSVVCTHLCEGIAAAGRLKGATCDVGRQATGSPRSRGPSMPAVSELRSTGWAAARWVGPVSGSRSLCAFPITKLPFSASFCSSRNGHQSGIRDTLSPEKLSAGRLCYFPCPRNQSDILGTYYLVP